MPAAARVDTSQPLLSPSDLAELGPSVTVGIPLELVDPNARNPRSSLPEIDALADNIHTFGLLQPVTVRRAGDRYELLGGHRRLAAFTLLREREPFDVQWRTIPAVIRTATDEQADLMLISAQVHTRAWKPREEAYALERLVLAGQNLRQVGESLNRTESWASKRLRVYADSVLSGYVQSGQLLASVAEVFISVKDPAVRRNLAERATAEQWGQPRAKAEVRRLQIAVQLRDLDRRVREMLDILSSVEPAQIPMNTARDLQVLRGRIDVMSGRPARIPTMEQAEKAAGVRQRDRPVPLRGRRKPGYKPRI